MRDEIPPDLSVFSAELGVLMEPTVSFALTQILNNNKNKMGHDFNVDSLLELNVSGNPL